MNAETLVILLAEDDDGHAELVQRNLARAGVDHPLVRVRDGQEALDFILGRGRFSGRPPSALLLLLDINMPRIDGVEVLRQVKCRAETARLPVIMLTTADDPREIERCYELGCNVYITKSVDSEALVEAIRRLGLLIQVVRLPRKVPL